MEEVKRGRRNRKENSSKERNDSRRERNNSKIERKRERNDSKRERKTLLFSNISFAH